MRALILTTSCLLLVGCAGTKKASSEIVKQAEQQTAIIETVIEEIESQVFTYGGLLSGGGSILTNDPVPAPLFAESANLKVKIKPKPRYDTTGNVNGFDLEFWAEAKPTTITNENRATIKTIQAQQSTQSQEKTTEALKMNNSSGRISLLAGAMLMLFLTLALAWVYLKARYRR